MNVELVQLMAGAARLASGRSREARRLRDRLDAVAGHLRRELAAGARAELERRRREGDAIEAAPPPT